MLDTNNLKTLAQSDSFDEQAQASIEIEGHQFEVNPKGSGKLRFVLAGGCYVRHQPI